MSVIFILGVTAFLLCLIITPIVRDVFLRARLVDHPDEERKFHRKAIPRVGGIAVLCSYLGAFALILFFAPHEAALVIKRGSMLLSMLPAVVLIFTTGLLDDLVTLKPWQKLLGQALAATVAISLGVRLDMPHGLEWLGIACSFIWLLACANALNLIDGMDGLASGVALFATLTTLTVAIVEGNIAFAMVTVPLAGCLLSFLRYNFSPASIFLGDCGSLTVGFMLGCFGLIWSRRTGSMLEMAAPMMALSLPLLDVTLAVARRSLRRVPIFKGDRHHIHHKVLARAVETKNAVLILYGVCGLASILALVLYFSEPRLKWFICLLFISLVLFGIKQLRYIEFAAMTRYFSRRSLSKVVHEEIYLDEFERAMAKADTTDAVWDVACTACERFQFSTFKMTIHNRNYEQNTVADEQQVPWQIILSLGTKGEMIISKGDQPDTQALMLAVLNCLQVSIAQKSFTSERNDFRQISSSYSPNILSTAWMDSEHAHADITASSLKESVSHSTPVANIFIPTAQ